MPSGSEEYRGYKILWDVTAVGESGRWKATGSVVWNNESLGVAEVKPIPGMRESYGSEGEARKALLESARRWIDQRA